MNLRAASRVSLSSPPLYYTVRIVVAAAVALGLLLSAQAELLSLGVLLLAATKWQLSLGGPRLWLSNLRDNGCDLLVLSAIVALLYFYRPDPTVQFGVVGLYLLWQTILKPMSGPLGQGVQALTGLFLGLTVLFLLKPTLSFAGVVVLAWAVAAINADHFLTSLQLPVYQRRLLITAWALVVAELAWLAGRWNIIYGFAGGRVLLPQIALIAGLLAYLFGMMYFDHSRKVLSRKRLRSYLAVAALGLAALIFGSQWVQTL